MRVIKYYLKMLLTHFLVLLHTDIVGQKVLSIFCYYYYF